MARKAYRYLLNLALAAICLGGVFPFPGHAQEMRRVAVVVSQRIKPYVAVLDGMSRALAEEESVGIEPFFLSNTEDRREAIRERIAEGAFRAAVAIGPEAGRLVWSLDEGVSPGKIYAAILNPDMAMDMGVAGCGVPLNIPVPDQVAEISATFPGITRIGLLFDSRINGAFHNQAARAARAAGLTIVPLDVSAKKGIPGALKRSWDLVDCIWMIPDATVISEKIVQYVIKQAIYRKKGVLGYNPFFVRSGAVFAFTFDYGEIGGQAAGRLMAFFEQGVCQSMPPRYHRSINRKMTERLGIRVEEAP